MLEKGLEERVGGGGWSRIPFSLTRLGKGSVQGVLPILPHLPRGFLRIIWDEKTPTADLAHHL